ncbi:hypothetical protein ES288_D01G191400v1 [Gossypium darwinii]|uniref:Uncharacterized protein n=1 Tax=Gossypium darwinii TaxID=34276 RepID=A0A5D2DRI8_GOSDA|nr:hypothetical protein ES288_D01G191400v1 [Gossypium darwinii]
MNSLSLPCSVSRHQFPHLVSSFVKAVSSCLYYYYMLDHPLSFPCSFSFYISCHHEYVNTLIMGIHYITQHNCLTNLKGEVLWFNCSLVQFSLCIIGTNGKNASESMNVV